MNSIGLLVFCYLFARVSFVVGVGSPVVLVHLAQHQHIRVSSEGVSEDCTGLQPAVAVVAGGLASG